MEEATLQELLESRLKDIFSIEIAEASPQELFLALANVVKSCYANDWSQTRKNLLVEQQKQAYYFSIEFLPGKLLKSNLLNLGFLDTAEELFEELSFS